MLSFLFLLSCNQNKKETPILTPTNPLKTNLMGKVVYLKEKQTNVANLIDTLILKKKTCGSCPTRYSHKIKITDNLNLMKLDTILDKYEINKSVIKTQDTVGGSFEQYLIIKPTKVGKTNITLSFTNGTTSIFTKNYDVEIKN